MSTTGQFINDNRFLFAAYDPEIKKYFVPNRRFMLNLHDKTLNGQFIQSGWLKKKFSGDKNLHFKVMEVHRDISHTTAMDYINCNEEYKIKNMFDFEFDIENIHTVINNSQDKSNITVTQTINDAELSIKIIQYPDNDRLEMFYTLPSFTIPY